MRSEWYLKTVRKQKRLFSQARDSIFRKPMLCFVLTQTLLFQFLSSRFYSSIHDSSSQLEPISAGMRIKGKEKSTAPSPCPPKHHPYLQFPFFLLNVHSSKVISSQKKEKKRKVSGISTPQTRALVLTPLFPCSQRQIFLESWELSNTGPHTVSERSTAGGRQTHTHTHLHTLTKWRLWQKFPLHQKLLMNLITTLLLRAENCRCLLHFF